MSSVSAKIMLEFWFGKRDDYIAIEDIFALFKKDEQKDVKSALKDLKRYEFIKQKKNYDGSIIVSLSEKGKLRALNYVFRRFDGRKEKWDGKWRMIAFDIPDYCTKGRKALVYRLKSGDFYELQKSFFVYPYDCEREINALVNLFKIEKYVMFGLLDSIKNQDRLKHHYKLNDTI